MKSLRCRGGPSCIGGGGLTSRILRSVGIICWARVPFAWRTTHPCLNGPFRVNLIRSKFGLIWVTCNCGLGFEDPLQVRHKCRHSDRKEASVAACGMQARKVRRSILAIRIDTVIQQSALIKQYEYTKLLSGNYVSAPVQKHRWIHSQSGVQSSTKTLPVQERSVINLNVTYSDLAKPLLIIRE